MPDRFNRVQFHAESIVQIEIQFERVLPLDVTAAEPARWEVVQQKVQEINRRPIKKKESP